MKLTIGRKLTYSFLGLAGLVLLSGIIGIIVLNQVSGSADTVVKEKLPVEYAVLKANVAVEKVEKAIADYATCSKGSEEKKRLVFELLDEFDMWIAMVRAGTESDEFRSSPAGKLFVKKGLTLTVPPGSSEMLRIIDKIVAESEGLRKACAELIESQDEYLSYSVTVEDKNYDLPTYLLMLQQYQLDWFRSLSDAVNIVMPFERETDPTAGPIGRWLTTYQVDNPELMKQVEKAGKYHKKLMSAAQKINEKNDAKWKQRYFNRSRGSQAKTEQLFIQLQEFMGPIYETLETKKSEKLTGLAGSAEAINKELHGLVERAENEMAEAMAASETAKKSGITLLIGLTVAAVVIAIVLGLLISRYMTRSITSLAKVFNLISQGDLKETVDIKSKDELGDLARDTNRMSENLRDIIGQIADYSSQLTGSSGGLTGVAETMGQSAQTMSEKSQSVSAAAEEMNANMQSVAAACEEAATNINTVSIATDEINSSLAEVAKSSEEGRHITGEAVERSDSATVRVNELGTAAAEISKVTEVISEISEQTNLLALNATIEAARAGDAGKGFAVVASEIKALALQTAEATNDIRTRIQAIQDSTAGTVEEIEAVSKIIQNVNDIVGTIAAAVEEQSATTREIATNMTQASDGLQEVNENVSQSTVVTTDIASEIAGVNESSNEVLTNCDQVQESSVELKKLATGLQEIVSRFKV